jgi:glutamyl-tRNA(Gln) amidotransferase subunit D
MYSNDVQTALKKAEVKIGERVIITKGKQSYEGLLMPRIETGDLNSLVIKLDNGYNIGIKHGKDVKISKSKNPEPKEIKEEIKFEKGKEELRKLEFDSKKPSVALIVTGGTILNRIDYKTGGVAPLEKPEELLQNVPELAEIVNLRDIVIPFMKATEDFEYSDWQKIADVTARELNKNEGVIIALGTDAMHYTAAALAFMLKGINKPVVLVGSQRSSDRGSSDAWMNLICAAYASISDVAEVVICMHGTTEDTYCNLSRGVRTRKMHSSRRDAFQVFDDYPIARIWPQGKIEILTQDYKKRSLGIVKADTGFEPKVALVIAYPDSDPQVLEWYVSKGYKGIVIEGMGLGHVPTNNKKSWIPIIKKLSEKGIAIVVTTQTLYGRINENVYSNLRKLYYDTGAIAAEDMLPEVALVKLSWALSHTKDLKEIRKIMLTNIAGEITERSLIRE